jgi:nitrogen fixation/metabolism regulation signal transduction histidine kinase
MKTVCAWCGKVMIEDEAMYAALSHGICADCLHELLGDSQRGLVDLLNSIEFPVLVTDETRAIRQVNRRAERMLGKPAQQLEGSTVGMAIDCVHAGIMGECGLNDYCAGCVLLRTIGNTHTDGQPRYGEYMQYDVATADGAKARRIKFSTTKMGDAVALAIEEIQDLPAVA